MCGLSDTGFDTLKTLAVGNAAALFLKLSDSGFSADTIMANKVQTAATAAMIFIAFA
jgi:hypothetical protein